MHKLIAVATSLLVLSLSFDADSATTQKHVSVTTTSHPDVKPSAHVAPTASSARYKRIRARAHRNAALARSRARAMRLAEEAT
ncbi:MAG: hypothetical protein NVSMB6_24990 [Burkholderiaceae bacterium]